MRGVAEPVARMTSREDECTGRFREGRYKCPPIFDRMQKPISGLRADCRAAVGYRALCEC